MQQFVLIANCNASTDLREEQSLIEMIIDAILILIKKSEAHDFNHVVVVVVNCRSITPVTQSLSLASRDENYRSYRARDLKF